MRLLEEESAFPALRPHTHAGSASEEPSDEKVVGWVVGWFLALSIFVPLPWWKLTGRGARSVKTKTEGRVPKEITDHLARLQKVLRGVTVRVFHRHDPSE